MIPGLMERLLIASVRVLVRGPVADFLPGQRIYVVNHSSHLDALLLLSALPPDVRRTTRPLAAADYWTADPVRRYLIHSVFRAVLVGRDRTSLNPLEPAVSALRQGDSLIVFPEGTRGPGESLLPLKPGIAYLARSFPQVDIVPAWIENAHRILPKGSALLSPAPCRIRFGVPLRWAEGDFLGRIREAMEGLRTE